MEQDNPQQADFIYAAGFFDGEGHVAAYLGSGPNRNAMVFKVSVTQSSDNECPPAVLKWFQEKFGGSLRQQRGLSPLTRRAIWDWNTTSRNARDFMAGVEPYLKVKGDQIRFLLETWEIRFDRTELEARLAERKRRWGRAAAQTEWRDSQKSLGDATVGSAGTIQPAEVAEMTTRLASLEVRS